MSYLRIGAQKLGGVTIQTADGTIVIIEAQESQAKLFNDALSLIEKGREIMSQAEEKFMTDREKMELAIREFYASCGAIEIDDDGFHEDIAAAIFNVTSIPVLIEHD